LDLKSQGAKYLVLDAKSSDVLTAPKSVSEQINEVTGIFVKMSFTFKLSNCKEQSP